MIVTTIKYTYECESCGNDYVEQRKPEEITPFFTKCFRCNGNFIEISTEELIHEEPDPVTPEPVEE